MKYVHRNLTFNEIDLLIIWTLTQILGKNHIYFCDQNWPLLYILIFRKILVLLDCFILFSFLPKIVQISLGWHKAPWIICCKEVSVRRFLASFWPSEPNCNPFSIFTPITNYISVLALFYKFRNSTQKVEF